MKNIRCATATFLIGLALFFHLPAAAQDTCLNDLGDTCMFTVTADDLPPNIMLLIDTGAHMQHVLTHPDYDPYADYRPYKEFNNQKDAVTFAGGGDSANGFYHPYGYVIVPGNKAALWPAGADGMIDTSGGSLLPSAAPNYYTLNGKTIALPDTPNNNLEYPWGGENTPVKDNVAYLRYSANYLNWLFYSSLYTGVGTGLSNHSLFFETKKAIFKVAKLINNKAQLAIMYSPNDKGATTAQPLKFVVNEEKDPLADSVLDAAFVNNINNMGLGKDGGASPIGESLASAGGYYKSPRSGIYCERNFIIMVSPGRSSMDLSAPAGSFPASLSDADGDGFDDKCDYPASKCYLRFWKGEDGYPSGYPVPINKNGSTFVDDVAHHLYTHDVRPDDDAVPGFQNISTFTIGLMAEEGNRKLLINTSNNGNGYLNLYPDFEENDHPDYGRFHFDANSPAELETAIMAAINQIFAQTSAFVAPVVPVTRTYSGDRIYMAFFKPTMARFWMGNLTKYGINVDNEIVDKNDELATWPNGAMKDEKEFPPYWQTKDWADPLKDNYMPNNTRKIFTYFGTDSPKEMDASVTPTAYNSASNYNAFTVNNAYITDGILGFPPNSRESVINWVRGADAFDEDGDLDKSENREFITGDILHSEPLVVTYRDVDPDISGSKAERYIFYGANDGMLHCVNDDTGKEAWAFIPPDQLPRLKLMLSGQKHQDFIDSSPKAYIHDENKDRIIGYDSSQLDDYQPLDQVILVCGERKGGSSYFALDITNPLKPKYMWRITGTKSGHLKLHEVIESPPSTKPIDKEIYRNLNGSFEAGETLRYNTSTQYRCGIGDTATHYDEMATISNQAQIFSNGDVAVDFHDYQVNFQVGAWVSDFEPATRDLFCNWFLANMNNPTPPALPAMPPFILGKIASVGYVDEGNVVDILGETWSEPAIGKVKDPDNILDDVGPARDPEPAVMFIGGGYDLSNAKGKAVLAVRLKDGKKLMAWTTGMDYSIPSKVKVVDSNGNGFIDKVYVGDTGGQMWRIGKFTDASDVPLRFPRADENIKKWQAQVVFESDPLYERKFFYPPSVTLEIGYDMLFFGSGDRECACSDITADKIYAVKDLNGSTTLTENDLVNMTDPSAAEPDLSDASGDVDLNGRIDQGWFVALPTNGEKVLSEGTVFYKVYYTTTFRPGNDDACVPGGLGRVYALSHLTGEAAWITGNGSAVQSITVGGGIPSKPIIIMSKTGVKMFVALGSTLPDADSISESYGAGIISLDPVFSEYNFFPHWWRDFETAAGTCE